MIEAMFIYYHTVDFNYLQTGEINYLKKWCHPIMGFPHVYTIYWVRNKKIFLSYLWRTLRPKGKSQKYFSEYTLYHIITWQIDDLKSLKKTEQFSLLISKPSYCICNGQFWISPKCIYCVSFKIECMLNFWRI